MQTGVAKRFRAVCVAVVLAGCLGFFQGCVPHAAVQSEDAQQIAVRQPEAGDPLEAFWDAFEWRELSAREQALWAELGWDEASWQGNADEPASERKLWSELTEAERNAATALGDEAEYWDYLLQLTQQKGS